MSLPSCSLRVGQIVVRKYASSTLCAYESSQEPCWWSWLINKDGYIKKVNGIIDDGIKEIKYVETADDTCNELTRFQDFYTVIFIKMNSMKRSVQDLIKPVNFLQPLKSINLNLSVILL